MNQFDTTLQIILPFVCLWELLVAIFAWMLDRHTRANRYLVWTMMLLAFDGFAQSQLSAAANLAQARPWTYVLAATQMAIGPTVCVVAFSLLRPDAWPQERRKRWLWRIAHVLIFVPAALTLSDVLLDTHLLYTGLDPETYAGGFVLVDTYLQGDLSWLVIALAQYVMNLFALLPTLYVLRDRQAAPLFRQRARWLIAVQFAAPVFAVALRPWFGNLAGVALTGLLFGGVYVIMFFKGLVSDRMLRQRLANVSLGLKIYIGLGTAVIGLLIVGAITIYSSAANRQLVDRTLNRQRQLAGLASDINTNLLSIQNEVFAFYDTWSLTGFEKSYQAGFGKAREIFIAALEERLQQIDANIVDTLQLDPDPQTRADLENIVRSVNAYDLTIREMTDHMERRGFNTSGQIGQLQETLDELEGWLNKPGLESLQITLVAMDRQAKDFFLRSDIVSARMVSDLIQQQRDLIAAVEDDVFNSAEKSQLNSLLDDFDSLFFAASSEHRQLQDNRNNLINQSTLAGILVSKLFTQQQTAFEATVEQLQLQQSDATITITGLVVLTFLVSTSVVYFIASQITRPVHALRDVARQLGAGELSVRANVHGSDEIGDAAAAFNLMANRLQELLTGLEEQVAIRTHDLERYSGYLEASAEVNRVASSILDADELIRRVTELIRQKFDLYYVGLFLKDESEEWAVLQAGTGEAGRVMMAREHRLHLGGGSIIGWSIEKGQARVARPGEDVSVHLTAPELHDTRSEAAIPLRSRGRVWGALSVHHSQPDAFEQGAIAALQTMADQVTVALDNATQFTERQQSLEAAQRSYGELSHQMWLDLLRAGPDLSFRGDEHGVSRVADTSWRPEMARALQEGQTVRGDSGDETEKKYTLSVPIKAGDDVIGVLDTYKLGESGVWMPDEIDTVQEITAQLALALDNARLHQNTRTRAHREQLTAQITTNMRETLDVETVLRTAVEEIYDALGLSELVIYLSPETG